MIERKITIHVSGVDEAAVEDAFEEATERLRAGCLVGKDENETGSFYFTNENCLEPDKRISSYIRSQLKRVQPAENELIVVQFGSGPIKTNWLNLTPAQFEQIKNLLIKLKERE